MILADADTAVAEVAVAGGTSDLTDAARIQVAIRTMLQKFLSADGRAVSYASLLASPEAKLLKEQCGHLVDLPPDMPQLRQERLAFWLNLYNALVIQGVGVLPANIAVSDSKGFFSREACRVDGRPYSLDDIEFGILKGNARRPWRPWRQFRIWDGRARLGILPPEPHLCFALVKGTRSGPALRFWEAEGIEGQLHEAATRFINSGGVVIDQDTGILTLSRLFRWHAADFGGGQGVMKFIASHLESAEEAGFLRSRAGRLKVAYLDYDPSLNGA